jgi:hypothetical protein
MFFPGIAEPQFGPSLFFSYLKTSIHLVEKNHRTKLTGNETKIIVNENAKTNCPELRLSAF